MARRPEIDGSKLDDAARAGWLYYVAGNTQDEIARKLGVSRQSAQRLVSLSVSEKLIKVRLDHPIAHCLELSQRLQDAFALTFCEVVPSDPDSSSTTLGVAEAAAAEMERYLQSRSPVIFALGSGRTLRAAVEQLPPMECPQHKIVSLVGNIAPDGTASFYDVIMRIADIVKAPHYPMPLPVIAASVPEKSVFLAQKSVANVTALARRAHVTFVGIGEIGNTAQILSDGFVTREELQALSRAGGVGEIVGWVFDEKGALIEGLTNERVTSVPLLQPAGGLVIAVAMGSPKLRPLTGALRGKFITGLITSELTAEQLVAK
jgi:DNA-binding transcriptional regulator LsrR (DeoR family)